MTSAFITSVAVALPATATLAWLTLRTRTSARSAKPIHVSEVLLYQPAGGGPLIGIATGDLRRARCAELWVNPENTDMRMARIDEFSISSIIRYEGAHRDATGRVVHDVIADELDRKVGARRPVAAGTTVLTGAGRLAHQGVRYVAHTAAVQGEPGAGYRQVSDIGRCALDVLAEVDRITDPHPVRSVLFPLLGAGQGGGDPKQTALALAGAALNYLAAHPNTSVTSVYILAYTDLELAACRAAYKRLGLQRTRHAVSCTPTRPAPTSAPTVNTSKALRVGIAVDVVGYTKRTAPAQDHVQERMVELLHRLLDEIEVDLERAEHEWTGDGALIYLPHQVDLSRAIGALIEVTDMLLRADNQVFDDRIRLRMAIAAGLMGPAPTGYSGPLAVVLSRMLDAPPLRQVVADLPEADLAVLLSDYLYSHVLELGYNSLPLSTFQQVEVDLSGFKGAAWLWTPAPAA